MHLADIVSQYIVIAQSAYNGVKCKQTNNVLTHRGRVTYMCQYTKPSLFQIMACRLIGDKPLSEPMMAW